MHFMSRVFSNTKSLMTSVCMLYVGTMAASSYLSLYADKLLKEENQSNSLQSLLQTNVHSKQSKKDGKDQESIQ